MTHFAYGHCRGHVVANVAGLGGGHMRMVRTGCVRAVVQELLIVCFITSLLLIIAFGREKSGKKNMNSPAPTHKNRDTHAKPPL